MRALKVNDILKDKVLVSRESAHLLEDALSAMMAVEETPEDPCATARVAVDFETVEGIAPSFLDELLLIFESLITSGPDAQRRGLVVLNPPTRLSLKFEGVARGHGMSVRALPDGSWLLEYSQDARA